MDWIPLAPEVSAMGLMPIGSEEPGWRFFDLERQLDLNPGESVVRINGIRVHLDRPVREDPDGPMVLRADWDGTIAPILDPQSDGGGLDLLWIDAGHGGKDSGAVNTVAGLMEKDLVLAVTLELARILTEAGLRVGMSRADDRFVPLEQRVAMANEAGADLFVSIHLNAFEDSSVCGVEVFVLAPEGLASTGEARRSETDDVRESTPFPGNRFDRENAVLGYCLQRALVTGTGDTDRGLKRARFAVLKGLNCPGALVELGFLSEPETAALFADSDSATRYAKLLAAGLLEYSGSD